MCAVVTILHDGQGGGALVEILASHQDRRFQGMKEEPAQSPHRPPERFVIVNQGGVKEYREVVAFWQPVLGDVGIFVRVEIG